MYIRASWRKAWACIVGRAGSASGERDLFSLRWGGVAPAASLVSTCSTLTLTLSTHALLLSHLSVRSSSLDLVSHLQRARLRAVFDQIE